MDRSPALCRVMGACPLPYYFVLKVSMSKDSIHHKLYIMRGGGIAVQVQGASGLEGAMHFDQPCGHHRDVGHYPTVAEPRAHCAHQNGKVTASSEHVFI